MLWYGGDYWAFLLPTAKKLGQEYRVGYLGTNGEYYVIATTSNTNLLIDKTDDGTWDTNATLNPGTTYTYSSTYVQSGSRVQTNKPVVASERFYYAGCSGADQIAGMVGQQSSIATTSDVSPSPADFHSEINISNKVWNMLESVYNLTLSGSIPGDFTPWPGTSILNITVGKYYASNASLIGSAVEIPVSLASGGNQYNYSFSYSNTSLLDELGDEQYYQFTYRLTTPNSTGTYLFNPFTVDIAQATVWKYTWE